MRFIPHKAALSFGRTIGKILRLILWKKTDRAEARCVKSLGVGITIAREIVRKSYMNLGMAAVEFIRIPKMKPHINDFMTFDKNSIKILSDALSRGNGVILMTTHMDNWELAAARVIHEGFPLNAVYTVQKNQGGANDIIMDIRNNSIGMKMIDNKGTGLREIFRVLRAGGIVVIMQDLDARKDGIMTDFLGLPASTHDGIVKLYQKFKSPVIPVHYVRDWKNPSHHVLTMQEILSDRKDKNGNSFGKDVKASLELCNEALENFIKQNPEQWLWLMDRWEYTLGKKIGMEVRTRVNFLR